MIRQIKRLRNNIDGSRRLTKQELQRGVCDNRLSVLRTHEIADILRDRRQSAIVFSRSLRDAKEKARRIVILHHNPRLIHNNQPALQFRTHLVPDIVQDEIHSDRAQFFLQVANVKHDELVLHGDSACVIQESRENTLCVFFQSSRERFRPFHVSQHFIEVAHSWKR